MGVGIEKNVEIGVVLGRRRKSVKNVTESDVFIVGVFVELKENDFCKMIALSLAISNFNFFNFASLKKTGFLLDDVGGMYCQCEKGGD